MKAFEKKVAGLMSLFLIMSLVLPDLGWAKTPTSSPNQQITPVKPVKPQAATPKPVSRKPASTNAFNSSTSSPLSRVIPRSVPSAAPKAKPAAAPPAPPPNPTAPVPPPAPPVPSAPLAAPPVGPYSPLYTAIQQNFDIMNNGRVYPSPEPFDYPSIINVGINVGGSVIINESPVTGFKFTVMGGDGAGIYLKAFAVTILGDVEVAEVIVPLNGPATNIPRPAILRSRGANPQMATVTGIDFLTTPTDTIFEIVYQLPPL